MIGDLITTVKVVHLLSAAVLLGTGAGIAFFMVIAQRTGDVRVIARTGAMVVAADFLFTAPAVIVQPASGVLLAHLYGYDLAAPWLMWSYGLYVLVGLCWLPVVAIQMRMARMAARAAEEGTSLPDAHRRLYRLWFALGWPAFAGVIAIYALMVGRPG